MTAAIEVFRRHGSETLPDGAPVLLLLHGRGSNEADLAGVASTLIQTVGDGSTGVGLEVVTPRAPWPGRPWGYGPGWAWYRYLGEDRPEMESLAAAMDALDGFVEGLPEVLGHEVGPLVLGGFSQGGTISLAWSLTRPGRAAGAVNLSGFLADVEAVQDALGTALDLPVFWGHGRLDPAIPHTLAEKGRKSLREAGVGLEVHDHDGGHTITPSEVDRLTVWLSEILSLQAGRGVP